MPRFQLEEFPDRQFEELADAAQEAEFLHEEHGRTMAVLALNDEEPFFRKGDTVYESQGAPE